MANPEHLAKLNEGVDEWNAWRKRKKVKSPDLSKAILNDRPLHKYNLQGANLMQASLVDCHLRGANLDGADLQRANLLRASFGDTSLVGANLTRVSAMVTNFSLADMTRAQLSSANLMFSRFKSTKLFQANFIGANLNQTIFVDTDLREANLNGCAVYGISAWNVKLRDTKQNGLIITRKGQPEVRVDDIEIAQFVNLLLNHQNLRKVITTVGEKSVLILGRFTERKELLEAMHRKLQELGYLPIIFDFPRPTDRDLTETVKVLAGMSLFVIADVTNPRSVPLELQATVPDYQIPFVPICQRGQPSFGMFDDLPKKYNWVMDLLEYDSQATLMAAFEKKVVKPALDLHKVLRMRKTQPGRRRSAED